MVGIPTGQDIDMQIHAPMHGNRAKKFLDQLKGECRSDDIRFFRSFLAQIGATAQIHDRPDKSFIHRNVSRTISLNANLVSQGDI